MMLRVVVHGLLQFASSSILNLYTEQLVTQLTMLLQYGDKQDDINSSCSQINEAENRVGRGALSYTTIFPGPHDGHLDKTTLDGLCTLQVGNSNRFDGLSHSMIGGYQINVVICSEWYLQTRPEHPQLLPYVIESYLAFQYMYRLRHRSHPASVQRPQRK